MLRCMTQLTLSSTDTAFDRTTRVVPVIGEPGRFVVELDEDWSSLVGAHGGYMCAIAVRGAQALVPDREVRTISTSFLHPGRVADGAALSVRELRRGRSVSTLVIDLTQDEELITTTRVTMTSDATGVEWTSPEPLALPPREQCIAIQPPFEVAHLRQAEAVIDPAYVPFTGGDRARIAGYLRPKEGRSVDSAWLAMATDWFPPPAFVRIEPPTGGVSMDLTTHIHQPHPELADDEWLSAEFEVGTSTGGIAVEHGVIAREDGTLVAESFHTRWTAQR